MGNHGSANDHLRRAVELIQAGVIGLPKEVHVWSDRPVWPQGLNRPDGADDPAADALDWDSWIGPAPMRPYKKGVYHDVNWRGWYDFGTGPIGDQGSHMLNLPFRALKLGYPSVIECEETSELFPETFPNTSRIRFEFPEREGLPPVKLWWYDGNPRGPTGEVSVLRPGENVESIKKVVALKAGNLQGGKLPPFGTLVVGTKGILFAPDINHYVGKYSTPTLYVSLHDEPTLLDAAKHEACINVPRTIPRLQAEPASHFREWLDAIKEGKPERAYSRFEIAGVLTESLLLGCVAVRVGVGKKMEWDGPNMQCTNLSAAAPFVAAPKHRAGWEI